ncbi:MAG TPA: GNAT family N-acetyltransferase [Kofleriaceae bacterium]
MFTLRLAHPADLALVLPRTAALNAHEAITLEPAALQAALARLLGDASLGRLWLVLRRGAPVGYALVTFGYDLEFNGRDAWLTELWIDDDARGSGAGQAVLELLGPELQALGVRAVHLQVRPDNPARRLYERSGFTAVERVIMSKKLG